MNELQKLPNPTNIPEAVSTGYQRQNTNLLCLQTGIDTANPYDDGTNIIIPDGVLIETNGILYKVISDIVLSIPDTQTYFIKTNLENMTLELTTEQGIFNPAKNAWYDSDNNRILNYVKPGTSGGTCILDISGYATQDITLEKGWYYADVAGAGGGTAPGIYTFPGGDGGRLKKSFYVPFPVLLAKAFSGSKGANGNGVVGAAGGAGSALYIPRLKLLFIASGGGGGYAGNGGTGSGLVGGSGGAGNGSNGGSGSNATIPGGKSDGGAYGDSTVNLLLGTSSVAGGAAGIYGSAEGKPGNNNVDSTTGGGGAGAKVNGSTAADGWVRIYKTAELMGAV